MNTLWGRVHYTSVYVCDRARSHGGAEIKTNTSQNIIIWRQNYTNGRMLNLAFFSAIMFFTLRLSMLRRYAKVHRHYGRLLGLFINVMGNNCRSLLAATNEEAIVFFT